MKIFDANISGSLTVSGSAHFQSDITVDGVINATISGTTSNAISASFATNADKLDGKDSTEFAITGSNVFKNNQTISGSLYVTNDVVINGTSYNAASSGSSGTSGSSGSSGTSGSSGSSGTAGTSGSSGSSGTSGSSGSSGTSGSSGSSGTAGTSGSSGSSGTSGSSGSSGTAGTSGSSGSSGTAGTSGTSVTVSGTNNTVGKFQTGAGDPTLVDSNISDNGTFVNINSNAKITGSLTITQNLTVLGSSSIVYTTASNLQVDSNLIYLNAASPAQRYAGIAVFDSGSVSTGSLLWDSLNNGWIYTKESGSTYHGGALISGPRNSGAIGNEQTTIANVIQKGQGGDHITGSNITDDGTTVTINSNTDVTGSLKVTGNVTAVGFTGSGASLTSIPNGALVNSSVTVTAGTGMSGGGSVALGSSVTLTNAGVTSIIAGTGISRDVATGGVTITNSGVTSAVAGTGVSVSAGTGAVTFSIGQAVGTGASVQFANTYITTGLGVGTAAPATVGLIRATNDVIAYYASDERLKENFENIPNSLDKLKQINGYSFDWIPMEGIHENEGHDIGVKAQEIEAVLPEIVTTRENGYKAVKYDRLVALLIETNKELLNRIEALEAKIK